MRASVFFTMICMALTGCSVAASEAPAETEAAELRSDASAFFVRSPLSSAPLERLRSALDDAADYAWVRNQGSAFGMQWERARSRPLGATALAGVAQDAFAFRVGSNRRLLRDLEVVAPTDQGLADALDAIGLFASISDAETEAARQRVLKTLREASKTRAVTVMKATLAYQPDMHWEGALVVLDESHREILFATGGYGT